MAKKQNFSMFRGEDKILQVTLDPVLDISTWTLAFTVRLTPQSAGDAVIEKTMIDGITLSDPTHGIFQVALADADTVGLQVGKYAFDCKRINERAEAILVYGTLELLAEVTR
jgi:hypothetical protein